ncbi:PIR protein, pseudogene, putative [Plasmodium sp.]|nr:PIR protein, pseudogene, putative [Plasmodium sp.]
MNTYYVKLLLFTFLINILVLPHNENCENSHYYRSPIQNNTQRISTKSRLLAQTENHNPHYHNDPELKEIIDKLNNEAIKKYQQTHDPYKQLQELVEKNGTKLTGGNDTEPMSKIEKELLETYEEMFREENHIMLKSSMYTNDDNRSDKSSLCECTDINNTKLAKTKGKDKYLKHLKHRCTRAICVSSVGSFLLTFVGLALARDAALTAFKSTVAGEVCSKCTSSITILNMIDGVSMASAIKGTSACASVAGAPDAAGTAAGAALVALYPWGIVALVLLILAVILIILYIWLYRRRKNSWKHECKKHLCK